MTAECATTQQSSYANEQAGHKHSKQARERGAHSYAFKWLAGQRVAQNSLGCANGSLQIGTFNRKIWKSS